jgi:hypothetical protein
VQVNHILENTFIEDMLCQFDATGAASSLLLMLRFPNTIDSLKVAIYSKANFSKG